MCCDRIFDNDNNSDSMKTRSKVRSVQASGTWNTNDGKLMYRFDYVMEDDVALQANHVSEVHFKVGDEVDYEVTRTHETYGKSGKVSKPSDFQQKPQVDWEAREKKIAIGHAINNAVKIVTHTPELGGDGQSMQDDIKHWAKIIYKISAELNQEL